MNISQRLFLAVLPAIVGVFTVAGLAYWGAYHRAAPEWVVVAAGISAVGSMVLAWRNTRYVARRIERLAGTRAQRDAGARSALGVVRDAAMPSPGTSHDELDSIERVVDHLSSAVSAAQEGGKERERAAAERIQEYAVLLDEATVAVRQQLDQTRLALHILLENRFGPLNEIQVEMLEEARAGTDAVSTEVARLNDIAQLDRRTLTVRREAIRISEVLRALRPQLEADGAKVGVTLTLDLEAGLPRVSGDRIRLQQALELLLRHIVRHATPGTELTIGTSAASGTIRVEVLRGRTPTLDPDVALARRIIEAHAGSIETAPDATVVLLPAR